VAREVLRLQIGKRGGQPPAVRAEFTRVGDDRLIGSTGWTGDDGQKQERYQVVTIRDGKIADLQGCSSRRAAERFARKR